MRLQTALEFIVLLSAVAAFSIAAVGAYLRTIPPQGAYNSTLTYQPPTAVPQLNYTPYIRAYLSNITYENASNNIEIISYSPYNYSISGNVISEGAAVTEGSWSENGSGLMDRNAYLIPNVVGSINVEINITIISQNLTYQRSLVLETYATTDASTGENLTHPKTLYASIIRNNESVLYQPEDPNQQYSATQRSHCSYENFYYKPYGLSLQCGNARWDYYYFSGSCYSGGTLDAAYCVYLNSTDSSYSTFIQAGYLYNITIDLQERPGGATYTSNLSTLAPSGAIYSSGRNYGFASSNGVYGTGPLQYGTVLGNDTNGFIYLPNQTIYSSYETALNNLESLLGYYNGTDVSDSSFTQIQQAISSFNSQSSLLSQSKQSPLDGCSAYKNGNANGLACTPNSQFQYQNITAIIKNVSGVQNSSQQWYGSTINILN